jgi:uncharacterized protein YjiS (DUF1127 family)
MATNEYREHIELRSTNHSLRRVFQAVWMLVIHQREYRRSLIELSRSDSRLLRDVGLETCSSGLNPGTRSVPATRGKWNRQVFFRNCRTAVSNCD